MQDVLIIGGGLYGCATAYHLLVREPSMQVTIVERDPAYTHAASVRSHAGVRILFSQAESIAMSRYGHDVYAHFAERMACAGEPAGLTLHRHGYLLIANTQQQAADIQANYDLQRSLGCNVELHDAASLAPLYPSLFTDDIVLAVRSPDDMWIDPHGALSGLRRKAGALGARFVSAAVTGLDLHGGRVAAARLHDGRRLAATWFVNAAGAWAPEICAHLGLHIPVVPFPQMVYYFETRAPLEQFGLTVDGQRVGFRPEGAGFLTLNARRELMGRFCWEPDDALFETENWPKLARRVPAFEALRLKSSYCCHYAYNTFDGNILLGAWPGQAENFLIATGASGHGLQHAPAAGRALAERIIDGRYATLDLARFSCDRVVAGRPDPERGFVA